MRQELEGPGKEVNVGVWGGASCSDMMLMVGPRIAKITEVVHSGYMCNDCAFKRVQEDPFIVPPELQVVSWLQTQPNKMLIESDTEAPWKQPDVFNITLLNNVLPDAKAKEVYCTTCVQNVLTIFYAPTTYWVDQDVRIIVAAITYARMDNQHIPVLYTMPAATFPNPLIQNSLKAAHHFHTLQEDNDQTATLDMCTEDQLITQFEKLTSNLGTGTLALNILGPLVASLVYGIKGLLVYPNDVKRFGIVKLAHFFALVDHIHTQQPIEEPVWNNTQNLILDTIEAMSLPQGFEAAREAVNSGNCDGDWHHQDLSKVELAVTIERDLVNFCESRSLFEAGNAFSGFPLPDIPAGQGLPKCSKKTSKRQCNSWNQ
ncbi:uncharacterized protein MELLADRAFT_63975 [Melampsora larici-populina 98AG31]|uniref:Uncharacterized protein n=1 Tax=Melampsora larici-populina (strain 98AG31 / pathotype 3-4-7) TaxID=747676 RepID=F4RPP6_MELLP|nr:uncharacterized protein MELLADRAFT_63975 [Melampsora larici-populina 98AG31]EGG05696.1 hypothetical protein MELLADRAFT_63975 [Melampsora larici-populina 98AG31]